MTGDLYPLLVEPKLVELIWGGNALVQRYGKPGDATKNVGESWECWDANAIANGAFAKKSIAQLRAQLGPQLLGALPQDCVFPILTKFIDARQPLSVQVHPDDAYAQRVEGQPNGKTECWYVLQAEPDASIVLGWNRDTSRAEYVERVKAGTLDDLLRKVPVKAGDVFYLPAGTLHAIGAGIILYETQQASDLTYRIYDYNRLGPDGKPRQLHVEKAADVLNYHAGTTGALAHLDYQLDGLKRTALVADPRFIVERVTAGPERCGLDLEGMPLIVTALASAIEIEARGATLQLQPYQTALVPAALDMVTLRATDGDEAQAIVAAPPKTPQTLAARLARAAVDVIQSTSFLAQFG